MLALQLWEGHPQLLIEGGLESIKLDVNAVVNDGEWHTIHLQFNYKVILSWYCNLLYCQTVRQSLQIYVLYHR